MYIYRLIEESKISRAIEFIETPLFESQRKELITDDEFRSLQSEIIINPDVGQLIVGTGGLRKVRLAGNGKGKSGGYRVIYLLILPDVVHLITLYKKGVKDSISQSEKNQMKKLASILKGDCR